MTKSCFLLDVRPRDADAPGFHDLHLDADRLMSHARRVRWMSLSLPCQLL